MILLLTEVNLWEREKWSYVLDMGKMGACQVSLLSSFVRLAREEFLKQKRSFPEAISNYSIDFYDSYDFDKKRLIREDSTLVMGGDTGYKDSCTICGPLSTRRLKAARDKMRDKKENVLYKNFESLFLKVKGGR